MSNVDATAYDAFGRILADGGEQTYALGMARGYDFSRLSAIMYRRFGDDYKNSSSLLGGFATGMLLAASRVNDRNGVSGQLPMSEVPNNPFADETESAGNILRWSADVEFEGGGLPQSRYTDTQALLILKG